MLGQETRWAYSTTPPSPHGALVERRRGREVMSADAAKQLQRYDCARSVWTWCISRHNLNTIRCSTGSQWRSVRVGVMWSRGPRRATRRAMAFWTRCNGAVSLIREHFILLPLASISAANTGSMVRGLTVAFTKKLLLCLPVKDFWQLVSIWRGYKKTITTTNVSLMALAKATRWMCMILVVVIRDNSLHFGCRVYQTRYVLR